MIIFWFIWFVLLMLAVFVMARPFIAQKLELKATIDQKSFNVDIAREQLAQLEQTYRAHEISKEEYKTLKYELEGNLIADISLDKQQDEPQTQPVEVQSASNKPFIFAIAFFVPVFSIVFYLVLGSPEYIEKNPVVQELSKNPTPEELEQALLKKLKDNPDDQQGWFFLAKTYMSNQQFKKAYDALAKLHKLVGDDAELLVTMADAYAMTQQGKLSGEPEKLILRALELQADNASGLWLAGMLAKEQGNTQLALQRWYTLWPLIEGEQNQQILAELIKEVGGKVPKSKVVQSNSLPVKVKLAESLLTQVKAGDTLFVFAKAVSGPPMPLAVVKKTVADLPLQVVLDDSLAMMPQMQMSKFKDIKLIARISKSGNAIAQSGDLVSEEKVLSQWQQQNYQQPIVLMIDKLTD